MAAAEPVGAGELFEWLPLSRSGRVRCTVCLATGFPGGKWQEKCRAGHDHPCPEVDCSRVFATGQGVAAHHRNAHRADREELYARRREGVLAYWERRRQRFSS